ncbi:Male sterility NAD-binding [Penicillium cf. griseofulvum]|uniref:Male sterility NAD-binding n=1 Tax=Penicillium cf. griseofulvum TaxID=2972120 RepID=A0A9W9M4M0_9EURO|nr:Male sterility NAD-binding [Penicillium cf. griseofulvum]KAJ5434769.1 Male sterility NAD-binding [Penicillium cf. griseofulvum]KAJ5452601.1 Male sterility NAD-binding [Penicillium cf. griseofulvum]
MGIQRGTQAAHAGPSSSINPLVQKFGSLQVLDDLIRLRAADVVQYPILAYPRFDNDAASYGYYTGKHLDAMINQAVIMLMDDGFKQPTRSPSIVALLTLSDLNMVITFFALSRLGYTVMMLSPRLSGEACVSLLETVNCKSIIYGKSPNIRATLGEILHRRLVSCRPMLPCSLYNKLQPPSLDLRSNRNPEKVALILHSSGSTGTPKPLFLTHKALMTHPLRGPGFTSFNTLPWYHLHGLSTALQAMWMRKTAYMWNAALPLTAELVASALKEARPESVAAVPYMLQILIDDPRGISALRRCKLVTYGGAPCPDELGDRLVSEGVHFGGSFGLTEAGLVAESISRPKGDPYWNYLKFFDNIRSYVWMKPISESDSLFECVYLAGHPALTTSNSNEPPGSFHSKDVFTPHPTISGRWKYISRLDDRINLVNGEKVLPLPIEGHIKQHPFVHDAVVVGVGKAAPGLLILRADDPEAICLSDEKYLNAIWPTIQEANAQAEAFSQISRNLVTILPHDAKFARTDKGSMIRAQVYREHSQLIESLYTEKEQIYGNLLLDVVETEHILLQLAQHELGIPISGVDANFFSEGVDSLKAIHFRRLVLQHFKFEMSHTPSPNVIFESGCISQLARHICALQKGEIFEDAESDLSVMTGLIDKYSVFERHIPQPHGFSGPNSVLLTGATGSIGAHVLYELLNDDSISTVYCLTRRESPLEAILRTLSDKDLFISPQQRTKIIALNGRIDQPDFGLSLDENTITHMLDTVSLIIHTAWPVNFNLPLPEFEPHIQGLYNLIQFSLGVQRREPAVLMFCSSISTALRSPSAEILEEPVDLDYAFMGYGQSKLIGERIVSNARRSGARAYSLRIGQVSGHSKKGYWNDSEALPLMIRSALTLGALPQLSETCSWLPVDKLALTILELARTCATSNAFGESQASSSTTVAYVDDSIFNLCNSREFTWSSLLHTLENCGFRFDAVSFEEWLLRLRRSEMRGEERVNPAVKLIHHYETMHEKSLHNGPKRFITEKAERSSVTLQNGRLRIIDDGILKCYAQDWLARWAA